MSLLTLRGLFERLRAPSQSQKGHFSEKTKLKKWRQNSWHWQKSAQSSEIFVTSRGICRSMWVSLTKGEHFPFWTKIVRTKIKSVIILLFIYFFPSRWVPEEVTVQKCEPVVRENCTMTMRTECEQVCKETCQVQDKKVCMTIPQQECKETSVQQCRDVPKTECKKVSLSLQNEVLNSWMFLGCLDNKKIWVLYWICS